METATPKLVEHYFLAMEGIDGTDVEVTPEQWIKAERRAGFRPKGTDRGQPATGGFGGGGIRGYIRYAPAHVEYRTISGELLAGALTAAFGQGWGKAVCEDQDVPVKLIADLIEHLEEADLMCDHSVGICCCYERAIVEDLTMWVAGNKRCEMCGGEGIGDQREVHHVDPETGDDWTDYETDPCEGCKGKGVVSL